MSRIQSRTQESSDEAGRCGRSIAASPGFATLAVRGGTSPDPTTGAILTPIHQSATYVQEAIGKDKGHTYSRASNPTVSSLERALGALEDAPAAVCFASGVAATHALFLAYLRAGDHVVVSEVVYGGTFRLLDQVLAPLGIQASFVDTSDVRNIREAIRPSTKLIFVETPGNPTLRLTDIRAASRVAGQAGIPLAVDNTFLTAASLRPLDLGATVSLYSTTKYIEGHNATIGGAIVTRDGSLRERLFFLRKALGSIQSPHEAWLTLQGIKTLPLRFRRHSESAQRVAERLRGHPLVARVLYPGLPDFPQASLARAQHTLHGGIIAFELRGGLDAATIVVQRLRLCSLAESLGAAETLVTHPATMTHGSIPREQRIRIGITDGLVRLSVGLEDPEDIIADLEQAFDAVGVASASASAAVRTSLNGVSSGVLAEVNS